MSCSEPVSRWACGDGPTNSQMRLGKLLYLGLEFCNFAVDPILVFVNSRIFLSRTPTHDILFSILNLPSALVRIALRLHQRDLKVGDFPLQRCDFVCKSFDSFGVDWGTVSKAENIY